MRKAVLMLQALLLLPLQLHSQRVEVHGIVWNLYALDTRDGVGGTGELSYYIPYDYETTGAEDLGKSTTFRFACIASRLSVMAHGYRIGDLDAGAYVDGDFFCGLGGATGTAKLRLREAYLTLSREGLWNMKIGQAWHPLSSDMPDVFNFNTGAPFAPYNRSPMVLYERNFGGGFSLTGGAIWQMQLTSTGPQGKSADYIKYGCTPEIYLGVNYRTDNLLARVGVDILSIKPRRDDGEKKVRDRITTFTPYAYLQYVRGRFSARYKAAYVQGGEHLDMLGGYGISGVNSDGSYSYTPVRSVATWISLKYGIRVQGILYGGWVKNLGTADPLYDEDGDALSPLYFTPGSYPNIGSAWRVAPTLVWNIGSLALGLEWEVTSVHYGTYIKEGLVCSQTGLVEDGLHWVTNNRIQGMVKFKF